MEVAATKQAFGLGNIMCISQIIHDGIL
jgi:hypothetical protein